MKALKQKIQAVNLAVRFASTPVGGAKQRADLLSGTIPVRSGSNWRVIQISAPKTSVGPTAEATRMTFGFMFLDLDLKCKARDQLQDLAENAYSIHGGVSVQSDLVL